jgi:type I restriction enzyme R subunit
VNKKTLTETDIRSKFITPAIVQTAGWDIHTQILEERYFTKGRVIVRGKTIRRGEAKKADYVLFYKPNLPIAVVEAKDNTHTVGAGMQQALEYAEILDVPFAYSSNGDGFLEHDRTGNSITPERALPLEQFPTPAELWHRYRAWKGITDDQAAVITQDYYSDGSPKSPRYYQLNAINRTVDAIARGQDRILLVMATGTGKTYTAFQIIWRLWKSGAKKRILFLVDRNILADQTKTNDFKPFGKAMTKITHRTVDKSYEIYLCLYQAVTGTDEVQNVYKEFSPDFFDLVVVDECHRGSAADDATWRQVLEYFKSATQIGLTATPKETKDVSNIDYFGKPIYTYSLKQGIDDGFLAPYKVVRIGIDRDLEGWRPESGRLDDHGNLIEDRVYNASDYDRNLILTQRTELVAAKITEFLKATNRFHKTIVFCVDVNHAERMRTALVNANPDLAAANRRYIMQITGDNDEGKAQLDNFIDPESTYPVIATTSQLMSTGVDAQTCHLIVLDKDIQSPTEFKQIIGRGTRINEDYNKLFFTIMDFRGATRQFADPDFDGDPVQIYEPKEGQSPVPPDDLDPEDPDGNESGPVSSADDPTDQITGEGDGNSPGDPLGSSGGSRPKRYTVGNLSVKVIAERVQYLGADGKPITESLTDYTRKSVRNAYSSLDEFLTVWNEAERKQAVLEELAKQGVFIDELAEQVGKDYDAFDLVCHVAFDQPALTRKERANNVRKRNVFGRYGDKARAVLDALLQRYADAGIASVESMDILKLEPFSGFGTPVELVRLFGGKTGYLAAIHDMQVALYAGAA